MTTTFLLTVLLQLQVRIEVHLPTVRFEVAPAMVEAEPGILVMHDHEHELLFVDGWYWLRWRDGRWYRARDHRGRWAYAEPRVLPAVLVGVPPGHYKHYKVKKPKWRVVGRRGRVMEARPTKRPSPGPTWAGSKPPGKQHHDKRGHGRSKGGKKK